MPEGEKHMAFVISVLASPRRFGSTLWSGVCYWKTDVRHYYVFQWKTELGKRLHRRTSISDTTTIHVRISKNYKVLRIFLMLPSVSCSARVLRSMRSLKYGKVLYCQIQFSL